MNRTPEAVYPRCVEKAWASVRVADEFSRTRVASCSAAHLSNSAHSAVPAPCPRALGGDRRDELVGQGVVLRREQQMPGGEAHKLSCRGLGDPVLIGGVVGRALKARSPPEGPSRGGRGPRRAGRVPPHRNCGPSG